MFIPHVVHDYSDPRKLSRYCLARDRAKQTDTQWRHIVLNNAFQWVGTFCFKMPLPVGGILQGPA